VQIFNKGFISSRKGLFNKCLLYFLVNSTLNLSNLDIIRLYLISSKKKNPFKFTNKILEWDTVLIELVKLLVNLFNKLVIFKLDTEMLVEYRKNLIINNTKISSINLYL
jgi:hypothetical protein